MAWSQGSWHGGLMQNWSVITEAGRAFTQALAERPEDALLVFDFDGTLASIVPDPEDSRLHERSAAAIAELMGTVGRIAIITGRNVETVRRLARLDERPELAGLLIVGAYGAERWVVGSGEPQAPERPKAIEAALPRVAEIIATCGVEGVVLEDKGRALGVHTRRSTDPEQAYAALLPGLSELAATLGLTVEPGRSVIELRSSTVTKGDAIRALVSETGASVVAMCGDDLGDLPAFEALVDLRADGLVTCRVVSASPEQAVMDEVADVLAAGPDGIADWLKVLANSR